MKDVIRVIDEKKFGVTVVINDRQEGGRESSPTAICGACF